MKLGSEDVAPPDARNELRAAVVSSCSNDLRVVRHRIIGVDEVGRGSVGNTIEMRSTALDVQLVPAHMWHFTAVERRRVETHNLTFEDVEPTHPTKFHTLGEKNLHAHTDAKQQRTLFHNVIDRVHQAALSQAIHAGAKRAHSREDHPSSSFNMPRVACDLCHVTHFLEALLHAAQVAHAVINNGNHSDGHYFVPAYRNQGDRRAGCSRLSFTSTLRAAFWPLAGPPCQIPR